MGGSPIAPPLLAGLAVPTGTPFALRAWNPSQPQALIVALPPPSPALPISVYGALTKAEQSKDGRRVVAVGLPDLGQRRHGTRRRPLEQRPDALRPFRFLHHGLSDIILQCSPADAA